MLYPLAVVAALVRGFVSEAGPVVCSELLADGVPPIPSPRALAVNQFQYGSILVDTIPIA